MTWSRSLTHPLALFQGHKIVAVAMTTAVPEVHALGGDDVIVIAGGPGAAGAGSAGQRADRVLNCSRERTNHHNAVYLCQSLTSAEEHIKFKATASKAFGIITI